MRHTSRSLRLYPDTDGCWVIRGRLDAEVGEVLWRALEAGMEALYGKEPSPDTTPEQRRADAVGLLAERALADVPAGTPDRSIGRAERYQVVMHVDAEGEQAVWERSGHRVRAETSRRVACDASLVSGEGGRKKRTVPSPIRRALEKRDLGCRFPAYGNRYSDAHHVRHWVDGGETSLGNLVLLCRRHHRLVHEGGFGVELHEGGEVRFLRPDGRAVPEVPPAPELAHDVAPDPAGALERADSARGLEIDESTPTPGWHGERLDMDWAIQVLWRPGDARATSAPSEPSSPSPSAPTPRRSATPTSTPVRRSGRIRRSPGPWRAGRSA